MKIIMLNIDDTLLQNKTDPTKWAKSIMKQIPAGVAVALVTSRSDNEYTETKESLKKTGIKYDKLFFHQKGNDNPHQTARKWKVSVARRLENSGFQVVVAIDNDAGARIAYGEAGIETTAPQWFEYKDYLKGGRK